MGRYQKIFAEARAHKKNSGHDKALETRKEQDIDVGYMAEAPKETEKVFTIPLRKAYEKSQRVRSAYAMRLIRDYIITHTKAEEVKIGKYLNSQVWERGIKKPPRNVKVTVIKDGNKARAELFGHKYEEFKPLPKAEKKGAKEKLLERLGPKAAKKQEEDQKMEGTKEPEKAQIVEQPQAVEK